MGQLNVFLVKWGIEVMFEGKGIVQNTLGNRSKYYFTLVLIAGMFK